MKMTVGQPEPLPAPFLKVFKKGAGFSTLELLIAFAVLTLSLSTVILVVFGNQSMAIDTTLAQRALYLAQTNLEKAGASTTADFDSITSDVSPVTFNSVYNKKITVEDVSVCSKLITSEVFWKRGLRDLSTKLTSLFVSTTTAAEGGGNCSPYPPTSDWDTTGALGTYSPTWFDGNGTGIALASVNGTRYAFVTTDAANGNDLYVIDTSDPLNIGTKQIYGYKISGTKGLNGIAYAKIDEKNYLFVLNNDNTNQLVIIDISNPASPSIVASQTLPNISYTCHPAESPCIAGRSLYYYKQRIYVGTGYLFGGSSPTKNNELQIFNVSNPSNPQPQDSIDVNRNVNDISVFGGIAYLATGPGSSAPYTPLQVYDLNTHSKLGYFGTPRSRAGTAVDYFNSKIFLGTSRTATGNNFYILSASDPTSLSELAAASLDGKYTDVGDIAVRGDLAFIGVEQTNTQNTFQVWNISDAHAPWRVNSQPCLVNSLQSQSMDGISYDNDLIFGSFRNNGAFAVIYDTPQACSP
jgi:hypothetical protein